MEGEAMQNPFFSRGIFVLSLMVSVSSWAQGGTGNWAFGGALGITASSQDDINSAISQANAGEGGISTGQLGNAWELYGFIQYRFGGSWLAFQLRPTYFTQSEDGKNGSGETYEYSVNGYSVFPIARFYMLENNYIKFFSQLGIGFGVVNGEHKEEGNSIKYHGADMGYLLGLGAEFCLWGGPHCISVEGNMRYLSVDRVVADSATGTLYGLSQASANQEVETGNNDLQVTMSGIQGFLGYAFHF
jgi:Outer membrane protein beta-barrel domain